MLINSVIPVITPGISSRQTESLLNQILQAGIFRALVVQGDRGNLLLDTAWGRLAGKGPDYLKPGDEIVARLQPTRSGTGLQILQHHAQTVKLPIQQLQRLLGANTSTPTVATFVANENTMAVLRMDKSAFRIATALPFEKGDRLMLTPVDKQHVEIRRFDSRSMLKQALSILLPRDPAQGSRLDALPLQRLAQALVDADVDWIASRLNQPGVATNTRPAQSAAALPTKPMAEGQTPQPSRPDTTPRPVEQLIRLLASLSVDGTRPSAEAIRQVLTTLTLLGTRHAAAESAASPAASPLTITTPLSTLATSTAGTALPQQLATAIEVIRQHPEVVQKIVQEFLLPTNKSIQLKPEQIVTEIEAPLRRELLQQSETLLTQITTQKSILGLQQENQQPLQINLSIPLQLQRETHELKLRIREKKTASNETEDSGWEISLSFEFGLLGMISTRLLLQGKALTAHFWAALGETKSLIDQHLDQFRQQLVRSGFEPGVLDCFHGKPGPDVDDALAPRESTNLLDLKA